MGKRLTVLWLSAACWAVIASRLFAVPVCETPQITASADGSYLIGSADFVPPTGGVSQASSYQWRVNGAPLQQGMIGDHLVVPFDGSLTGRNGEAVSRVVGQVGYAAGKWGSALAVDANSRVFYRRDGNLPLSEGTVEMWVALRAEGTDPIYSTRDHVVFYYIAPNNDYIGITQADNGVLYAGGSVGGSWQSAYNGNFADTRGWHAGEWHHVAYTYSVTGAFMRLYLDGARVAESYSGYRAPAATGTEFTLGSSPWEGSHYWVDEVRILGRAATDAELAMEARRESQPRLNESWLPAALLATNDVVEYGFRPSNGATTGTLVYSAAFLYGGIPLAEPTPPSTLLAAGATSLVFGVRSTVATTCRYSVGQPLEFEAMTPFDGTAPTNEHRTVIRGLDPDPLVVNDVYVRCAAAPWYVLHAQYRCLPAANPSFPRTGNMAGWQNFATMDVTNRARMDFWVTAVNPLPDDIRALRELNPHVLILTGINAVENEGLPEDYYLHDIYGNRQEVWPGCFRLNMTRPYVAEYQARWAYERLLENGLMLDGCFFDNTTFDTSWLKKDIYGEPFLYDANEDGVPDDSVALDAAWRAGVVHEFEEFRRLMPYAIVMGHMSLTEPWMYEVFNGIGLGIDSPLVIEGQQCFYDLWGYYSSCVARARQPAITLFESAPPSQISYGYGFGPSPTVPPSTLEFARTYYPYVRFGLALTLMSDGYFAHEYGDSWHGNNWWYDELDHDLGYPLGPAELVPAGATPTNNLIENGGFEQAIVSPWNLVVNTPAGCAATLAREATGGPDGSACARLTVTAFSGTNEHVQFGQWSRSLTAGTTYDLRFRARADAPRPITVYAERAGPTWTALGLSRRLMITNVWAEYTVTFEALETVSDGRIYFLLGETNGTVRIDDVRVSVHRAEILRREFTQGLVLLNPNRTPQTVTVGPGFRRLTGGQAARHEYILDDDRAVFTGTWSQVTYDSGLFKPTGPFYHDWGKACRQGSGTQSQGRWSLDVPSSDTYTLAVWWPAAPDAGSWSASVVYEVLTGGVVAASATLDQRTGGDEWHVIAAVPLAAGSGTVVRVRSLTAAPFIVDALHVRSAARYNDGTAAETVTLQPMDGIVLARGGTVTEPPNGSADDDGDGLSNADEAVAGTSPTDPESCLRAGSFQRGPGGDGLSFQTVTQRQYRVFHTTNLVSGVWAEVGAVTGTGGPVTVTNAAQGPRLGFYRISVALLP
jgi:hypothetical protein